MRFLSVSLLGALAAVGVVAQEWELPAQTMPMGVMAVSATAEHYGYGGAPEPTTAPNIPFPELLRRQQGATTVCGLLSTNTSWSFTCTGGWVCGYNSETIKNFGCCSSAIGTRVTGCYFPTACYDYSIATTSSCSIVTSGTYTGGDPSCEWNSLFCTNSLRPFCGQFVELGLTAYNCFASTSLTYNLIAPNAASATTSVVSGSSGITSTTASASRSSSSLSSSSSTLNTDLVPGGGGSTIRSSFSQQQQTAVSSTSATSSSSSGVAANLGMSAQTWCGYLMSLVVLIV